jgi:hypothetical protein
MTQLTWSKNAAPRSRYLTGRGAACGLRPDLRKWNKHLLGSLIIHRNHDTATKFAVIRSLPAVSPCPHAVPSTRRVIKSVGSWGPSGAPGTNQIIPGFPYRSDGCKSRKTTAFEPNRLGGRGSFPAAPGANELQDP